MRGEVYRLKSPKAARGHEQRGPRYAVVVQSDALPLSTWLVAPTSTSARPGPIRPEVLIGDQRTLVLVEQMAAIDPQSRLGDHVGHVSAAELHAVDSALRILLDLA